MIAALAMMILLAPTTHAGWFWKDAVEIQIPWARVGDRYSFDVEQPALEVRIPEDGEPETFQEYTQAVVLVEGSSQAVDAYGISRETVATRVDVLKDGELLSAERCHQLAGGATAVRTDVLVDRGSRGFGWSMSRSVGPVDLSSEAEGRSTVLARFGTSSCSGPTAFQGRALREGETVPLKDLVFAEADEMPDLLSQPAAAIEYAGRDALLFRFSVQDVLRAMAAESGEKIDGIDEYTGEFEFILADDIPILASAVFDVDGPGDEDDLHMRLALSGIALGSGESIEPGAGSLPERNPAVDFAAPEPLAVADEELELALPYAVAFDALMRDPQAGFGAWLAEHPMALLTMAFYHVDTFRSGLPAEADVDGAWLLFFADGGGSYQAQIESMSGVSTPLAPITAPRSVVRVTDSSSFPSDAPDWTYALPAELPTASGLARLSSAAGIEPGTIEEIFYYLGGTSASPEAYATISQVSVFGENDEGLAVGLDLTRGAMTSLSSYSIERAEGVLALQPVAGGVAAPRASAFQGLEAPPAFVVSATAAAGIALLAGLVKVILLPLFTRLRRDRLLDNPVRARLYERIRAEPGIHLAELEEFLGIGKGATRHHVDQLARHKLVFVLDDAGYSRVYASGHVPLDVARRTAVLRAGSNARVYELYATRPSSSLREAARELGMSAPSVHRAKKRLVREGLLPAATSAEIARA